MARASYVRTILALCIIHSSELLALEGKTCVLQKSRREYYQAYVRSSLAYVTNTKCGWWNWGRCTRNRVRYLSTSSRRQRTVLYRELGCCSGWTLDESGKECISLCTDGTFGKNCSSNCHCRVKGEVCDKDTGYCPSGCAAGWNGNNCQSPCENGKFGVKCESRCRCRVEAEVCDKSTGKCPGGCAAGWTGNDCQTSCINGTFGVMCASRCHCRETEEVCEITTGNCSSGCRPGWTGADCQSRHKEQNNETTTEGYNNTSIGSSSQACQAMSNETCVKMSNGTCDVHNATLFSVTENCTEMNLSIINSTLPTAREEERPARGLSALNIGLLAGASVITSVVVVCIAVYVCVTRRKRRNLRSNEASHVESHVELNAYDVIVTNSNDNPACYETAIKEDNCCTIDDIDKDNYEGRYVIAKDDSGYVEFPNVYQGLNIDHTTPEYSSVQKPIRTHSFNS